MNWSEQISKKLRIPAALMISLAVAAVGGFDLQSLSLCLLVFGAVFYRGERMMLAASILFGGLSVLSGDGALSASLVLTAPVPAMIGSRGKVSRVLFLASGVAAVLTGDMPGSIPMIPALIACAVLPGAFTRGMAAAAGILLMVLISGLPGPAGRDYAYASSVIDGTVVRWDYAESVDLSSPVLILGSGGVQVRRLSITLSAGGTRDPLPVGEVVSGTSILPVMPGDNSLEIHRPVFPVKISISRRWSPFSHPVIHFIDAEARIEQAY